jgi:hypothetical protein
MVFACPMTLATISLALWFRHRLQQSATVSTTAVEMGASSLPCSFKQSKPAIRYPGKSMRPT